MKILSSVMVAASLVLGSSIAHADEPSPGLSEPSSPPAASSSAKRSSEPVEEGSGERTTGIVLTSVGAASFAGAAVFYAYGSSRGSFRGDFGGLVAAIGLFPLAGGIVFSAIGIPLWVHGQMRLDESRKRKTASWLMPSVAPLPGGGMVGLGGTF